MASNFDSVPHANSSSSHRVLAPMEDPSSPFYLHHGETPGVILVSQPLTEDNSHENVLRCQMQAWIYWW